MDGDNLEESPRVSAGLLSKIFFWWMTPLFLKGRKKTLRMHDLYKVLDEDKSKPLGDKLEEAWKNESKIASLGSKSSLLKVLVRVFGLNYFVLGILVGVEELFVQIGQPLCLGFLIRYFEGDSSIPEQYGYLLVGGVILGSILFPLMHHTYFFATQRQGMQIRVAVSSLIYRKALKLHLESLRRSTAGQVVNLLSNDVSRFDSVLGHIHFMWVAPIQLGIVIYILWGYFGPYCFMGIILLVLFGPLQGIMGKLFSKLRLKTAIRTDKRMRILNEVFSAIQTVKIYAWEKLFSEMVVNARRDEITWIKRTSNLRAFNATLYHISSKIVVFITLLAYVLAGNNINSEKVFVTMALYNSVKQVFTFFVPLGVLQCSETMISIRRIQKFLLYVEKESVTIKNDHHVVVPNKSIDMQNESAIRIENLIANWDKTATQTTLSNISVQVKKHSLLTIVGETGSGKSSLLQSILHELTATSGNIHIDGNISYSSQEPWIFEGSVKENILFGKQFISQWYNQVVHACALKIDLSLFPYGDQTLVGDKGACLSGGQKARINLARTVYANADIILLDDPLSAVDTKVVKHIFNECILGILKHKTRILVTHQIQFLPQSDQIAVMQHGALKYFNSYSEFYATLGSTIEDVSTKVESNCNATAKRESIKMQESNWNEIEEDSEEEEIIEGKKMSAASTEELISTSNKSRGLYAKYFQAGAGVVGLTLLVLFNLTTQILNNGSDYYLQIWTKSEASRINTNTTANVSENQPQKFLDLLKNDRHTQIIVYSILCGSLVVASLTRTFFYIRICMKSSVNLHENLFSAVLRAPMTFFDGNPIGRILNVFTKDIGIIDDLLPITLFEALEAALNVMGVMVIVSIVNPVLLAPSSIVITLFYLIRRLYLRTARNIKRLEGVAKGPVFSHMSSSLNGLVTIRAFKAENELQSQFDTRQDLHSSAWFLVLSSTRWLAFVVESISVLFITCVTFSFMIFNSDGASVGLAISSAMTLTGMFQWGVRQSAETESQMISVERVSQYSKVKPEPPLESNNDNKPKTEWPSKGKLNFNKMTINYGTEKPVLHELSFVINGGEKIGVVGRTGAGKSTLVSCLFRLVDPSSGNIEIDGLNIQSLGLHDLRPKISMIPQEPILFNGTLRQNFDPVCIHTDDEIWRVIEKVNLKQIVLNLPFGLISEVVDKGSNFSVGQKQLICLGRALLKNNKILVLDEATASLDKETDSLIQNTIRENFSGCTIITVAHRLETIIDCDKVLVLDAGKIIEFDAPASLLSNSDGHFYKMVQQLGQTAAESLFNQAIKN